MSDVDILLGFGLVVLFMHNIILHRNLKVLHYNLKQMQDEMGRLQTGVVDLDTRATHLKVWSFKVHQWLTDLGGKKGE